MRLIDADAEIARLMDEREVAQPGEKEEIDAIIYAITNAPTISPRPDWTPCAEGLPTPRHKGQQRQMYLVSLETGCVSMMFYEFNPNGYLGEGWADKVIGVVAWKELPFPYRADQKEDAK